jgi:hypothetical protein
VTVARAKVAAVARSYVGTRFAHQGRMPGIALDCAGVPICVSRTLGLVPPDFDIGGYPSVPDGRALQSYCERHMQRITRDTMRAGDVVLVAWQNGPPQHLGIVYDHEYGCLGMIHAEQQKRGQVIATRLLLGRSMRFVAAYALPGVA